MVRCFLSFKAVFRIGGGENEMSDLLGKEDRERIDFWTVIIFGLLMGEMTWDRSASRASDINISVKEET